jgi:hypothetical protein
MRLIQLKGRRFGRWTVLKRMKGPFWICRCRCGTLREVWGLHLRGGHSKSCGCLRRELLTRHGHSTRAGPSREYSAWDHAKQRCYNPKQRGFKNYGGRGIAMWPPWRDSAARFVRDLVKAIGYCPKGHSIDRINNDGNYEPGNVQWATRKQQNNNTRKNRRV